MEYSYVIERALMIDKKLLSLLNVEKLIERQSLSSEEVKVLLIASSYDNLYGILTHLAGLVEVFGDEKLKEKFERVSKIIVEKFKNLDLSLGEILELGKELSKIKDEVLLRVGVLKKKQSLTLEDLK